MTGFICLDKKQDITSFSAVRKLGKILGEKKIGHTGTLDPMATGILCVALGGATRFIELLPTHEKSYVAGVKLGLLTDTLDTTGHVLKEEKTFVTRSMLEEKVKKFVGHITQVPPMYSAIKKNGVRLYDLARKGIEVERDKRQVFIKKIHILEFDEDKQTFVMEVDCSAGTYIRSLALDIGNALSTSASLFSLRRTRANGCDKCHTLEEIESFVLNDKIGELILPVGRMLEIYPPVIVTDAQAKRFSNGGELFLDRLKGNFQEGLYRVYSPSNIFLGVGFADIQAQEMKVKRIYHGD